MSAHLKREVVLQKKGKGSIVILTQPRLDPDSKEWEMRTMLNHASRLQSANGEGDRGEEGGGRSEEMQRDKWACFLKNKKLLLKTERESRKALDGFQDNALTDGYSVIHAILGPLERVWLPLSCCVWLLACFATPCGLWDLRSQSRDQNRVHDSESPSLSHWPPGNSHSTCS